VSTLSIVLQLRVAVTSFARIVAGHWGENMAKKRKQRRSRSRRRSKGVKQSNSIKATIKRQPLAVKGGMAVTLLNLVSDPQLIYQLQNKQYSNLLGSVKTRAMTPTTYTPIVVGVLVHKGAKILGVKGV
jgi:hypothetical protein